MRKENLKLKKDLINNYKDKEALYFADKYKVTVCHIRSLASKLKLTTKYQLINQKDNIIKDFRNGLNCNNLQQKYGHDLYNIQKFLQKHGLDAKIPKKQIYSCEEKYFDKIDSHEKAYWLGFIYADGNVYRTSLQICLAHKDIEIITNFQKSIQSNHKIYNDRGYPRLQINNQYLYNSLVKLGVVKNKSLVLKFPTEKQVPNKFINSFILGYFDGDGSISHCNMINKKGHKINNWHLNFISTFEFCKSIKIILDKITNSNGNIYKEKRTKNNVWYILYSGSANTKFGIEKLKLIYNYLYRNIDFPLNRKKNIIKEII